MFASLQCVLQTRTLVFSVGAFLGTKSRAIVLAACLLLSCTATLEPEPLPKLVPQSVTATVRRAALRLVRLETEHETFLTTPEHPFATPRSGWVSAGRLVRGDWVVSEKFGAVRLRSVRTEPAVQPVPVFNLSVASSHAYFVGTERVLVHNTKCGSDNAEAPEVAIERARREEEELDRQIEALLSAAAKNPSIAELKAESRRMQARIARLGEAQREAQHYLAGENEAARKALEAARQELAEIERQPPAIQGERAVRKTELARQIPFLEHAHERTSRILVEQRELAERAFDRASREKEDLERRIEASTSKDRIAELKAQRKRLRLRIVRLRRAQQEAEQYLAGENEAAREALEQARQELAELKRQPPAIQSERAARKKELARQIPSLERAYERTSQILAWQRELAELSLLAKNTPAPDAASRGLAERMNELNARLKVERKRARGAKTYRTQRADPERWVKRVTKDRNRKRRLYRPAKYVDDTKRARDPLELLEDELAGLRQQPPSESRDARVEHLTDQIRTKRRLVEVRRQVASVKDKLSKTRRTRQEVIAQGGNPSELDQKIEQAERVWHALSTERAGLRIREMLLAHLDGTPWLHAEGAVDEARLHEFERQLAAGLADEQQVASIEETLDIMDPASSDWQGHVLDEADDVDALLSDIGELLRQSASPERAAGLSSSFERLQQELREEGLAVEAAVFRLTNEHAHIQATQAGSSSGPTVQERLGAIYQEQLDLRAQWRARLQERLDSVLRQLNLIRSVEAFRDEAVEAELAREIALFERELRNAGG